MKEFIEREFGIIKLVAFLLALFLLVLILGKVKEYRFIGSGISPTNTITVSGEGRVERSPDTAKVSFTVRNESKDLKSAQSAVSTKVDAVTKGLKDLGIEEKYIKTESYNSYPQYDYPNVTCYGINCPRPGTPTIRGYEVSHYITVAIKDLDKVNDVLGVLGTNGVSDMSGPSFGFEDDDAISREARALAIADAKSEAKILARALGVRLGRVVSFNEGGSGTPMYALDMATGAAESKNAPTLPVGDQKVQSNVTIVYEVR